MAKSHLLEHGGSLAGCIIDGSFQALPDRVYGALNLLGCRVNVALQVIRHVIHLSANLARGIGCKHNCASVSLLALSALPDQKHVSMINSCPLCMSTRRKGSRWYDVKRFVPVFSAATVSAVPVPLLVLVSVTVVPAPDA